MVVQNWSWTDHRLLLAAPCLSNVCWTLSLISILVTRGCVSLRISCHCYVLVCVQERRLHCQIKNLTFHGTSCKTSFQIQRQPVSDMPSMECVHMHTDTSNEVLEWVWTLPRMCFWGVWDWVRALVWTLFCMPLSVVVDVVLRVGEWVRAFAWICVCICVCALAWMYLCV